MNAICFGFVFFGRLNENGNNNGQKKKNTICVVKEDEWQFYRVPGYLEVILQPACYIWLNSRAIKTSPLGRVVHKIMLPLLCS